MYPGAFDEIVSIAGQHYLVDDQYCCAPRCTCDDATLTSVPIASVEGLRFRDREIQIFGESVRFKEALLEAGTALEYPPG